MASQFGDFIASELFCPKCQRSQPVRQRLLLAAISLTATDIRWAHGGIRPATGEFLLYVHILVADLRAQGATVLGPQYVRLVLRGTLAQGATFLSIGGTGKVLGGSLAGTAAGQSSRPMRSSWILKGANRVMLPVFSTS